MAREEEKQEVTDKQRASLSGLPLQRYLANVVRESDGGGIRGWSVEAEEVPAGGGFIDMILQWKPGQELLARMAVEVKRYYKKDESRPMRLLFLEPSTPLRASNTWPIFPYRDRKQTSGLSDPPHLLCSGPCFCRLEPRRVQHCLFEERRGNQESLDAIIQQLLGQMEALSLQAVGSSPYVFVPVIVTNAELRVLQLGETDLVTGELTAGPDVGDVVEWVAYEKTLSQYGALPVEMQGKPDFAAWAEDRLRTVYIVRAQHFAKFLSQLELSGFPWKP
ncbi:MAG: hypothetical protein H6816_16375 [Phycisphaerales bacterium]|nr:hypothetical protein [Phycisphaerales bacterium]